MKRSEVVDLTAMLVEVPAAEVIADDPPTTGAVNGVTRWLVALRRRWRLRRQDGPPPSAG